MSFKSPLHAFAKVPSGSSLENALADSLSGMQFIDTTFYAYTRRLPSGKAGKPRAVRANSTILKTSSTYFRGLLSGPARRGGHADVLLGELLDSTDSYEYESDSDLEDEEEGLDALGSLLATPSEISVEKEVEDKLNLRQTQTDTNSGTIAVNDNSGTRVVHMNSVAADTLEALIFYIYTGNIYFMPLRSRGTKVYEKAKATYRSESRRRPACSSKSIYRFANEAGLTELKQLAEEHLFKQLDAENILDELFSRFTSRHPDIQLRQIEVLLDSHWSETTQASLIPKIQSIVRGDMPHVASVLLSLLSRIPVPVAASAPLPLYFLPAKSTPAPAQKPAAPPVNAAPVPKSAAKAPLAEAAKPSPEWKTPVDAKPSKK